MRTARAAFDFADKEHGTVTVLFAYDERGKPTTVTVAVGGKERVFDNLDGRYKACVTHCQYLIEHMIERPARTAHAQAAQENAKPWILGPRLMEV